MNTVLRILVLILAWLSFACAIVGIFVPVLPTTPLLLLSAFLFSKSSKRWHAFIIKSKPYKAYVVPFKDAGGMTLKQKLRMLLISFAMLSVSAILVQKPVVWIILLCVAVFLLWLVCFRIKTVDFSASIQQRQADYQDE